MKPAKSKTMRMRRITYLEMDELTEFFDDGDGEENKTPKNDNDDEKGKVINFSESIAKKKD